MDKEQFKRELIAALEEFFREEQGNRVTSNNIGGFSQKLLALVEAGYKPIPKKEEEK